MSSPRCAPRVASQSLVPPEPFVFLAANSDVVFFKSTVSAAIFTFSTRPSLLCSEPFQLFSNLVRNSLHKSRSLNAIQRRHPESHRGLEQSTLVLVPLIVVDLATNVHSSTLECQSFLPLLVVQLVTEPLPSLAPLARASPPGTSTRSPWCSGNTCWRLQQD